MKHNNLLFLCNSDNYSNNNSILFPLTITGLLIKLTLIITIPALEQRLFAISNEVI